MEGLGVVVGVREGSMGLFKPFIEDGEEATVG